MKALDDIILLLFLKIDFIIQMTKNYDIKLRKLICMNNYSWKTSNTYLGLF
jgi:hypothetical protein